jgi:hypothetical protein
MAKLDGVKVIDMTAGKIEKVAYEGAEYERAEHPIKETDLILNESDDSPDLSVGVFYKVILVDDVGDVKFKDDTGDMRNRDAYDHDIIPFRKVSAQDPTLEARVGKLEADVAALKGEQATATPKFKAGDKVRGKISGFVYTLKSRYPEKDSPGFGVAWRVEGYRCDEFLGENEIELIEEKPLAVGDYAKVVSVEATEESRGMPGVKAGQIVYLSGESDTSSSKGFKVQTVEHKEIGCDNVVVDDLVRATDEEIAEAKAALLKVGDYAKVVGETYHGDFRKGTVVKIAKDVDEDGDYKIELLDESDYDYAQASSLEKVDADKAAITDKWAKIGREVDEYKEGDVVRVLDVKKSFAFDLSRGEINVITKFCDNDSFQVGSGSGWVGASQVELVAPVESRVDRN